MSRPPSTMTQLAHAKRDIRVLERELSIARTEAREYRGRATKSEQELAEWKQRFDELLKLRVDVKAGARHE